MVQALRGALQPYEPGGGTLQLAGRRPRLDQIRSEREDAGFPDAAVLQYVRDRLQPLAEEGS